MGVDIACVSLGNGPAIWKHESYLTSCAVLSTVRLGG